MMAAKFQTYYFQDDGVIPNSHLPVIIYFQVYKGSDTSDWLEKRFKENNWTNNWRDIVFPYDHFHSTTHEVLGVGKGQVTLKIGGKNGVRIGANEGDVIILPAGVGHCAISESVDYEIVGGYPDGLAWDLLRGSDEERKLAFENIKKLKSPSTDPVFGSEGELLKLWQ